MNTIEIKSFSDLNRRLFEDSWQENILRHRTPYAFRGLSHKDYSLKTSLTRLGGDYENLESNLLESFKKYARHDVTNQENDWYWLTLAQHHGLPTRLLDWTYSPYVALHFMTEDLNEYKYDGVIWAVDYYSTKRYLPAPLSDELDKRNNVMFTVDLLYEVAKSPVSLTKQIEDYVIFFEPPSLDPRVVNQFALFSIFTDPVTEFDSWLKTPDKEDLYKKFIIPAKLKWEIRNKLDGLNINERVLFPGLAGTSRWLKRYYSPPPANAENTEDQF